MVDAVAAARIIGLYEETALAWDAVRVDSGIERGWLERFLAHVSPGGCILDIGCGSGFPIASALVRRGYRVMGVDSSPAMIDLCRKRMPQAQFAVADMREMSFGRRFDALLAWDSMFHLTADDQRNMFAVLAAHAACGAPLMFTSGPAAGEAIGIWQGAPLYHASLDPAEYRALLDANGFDVVAFTA